MGIPITVVSDPPAELDLSVQRRAIRDGKDSPEHTAMVQIASGCVRRLLEIGLPEKMALHARDCVLGGLENFRQRQKCGEWEAR